MGDQYVEANGRYLYVLNGVIAMNGRVLVPVRTIAQAMGAWVGWNAETGEVEIYSGSGAIVSGESYYDSDSLYWLSHIINAESGNQSLDGKLAVGHGHHEPCRQPTFSQYDLRGRLRTQPVHAGAEWCDLP